MAQIKYKLIWLLYISEMYALKTEHRETLRSPELGSMPVTKNTIPFISIGTDNVCEYGNKLMQVWLESVIAHMQDSIFHSYIYS